IIINNMKSPLRRRMPGGSLAAGLSVMVALLLVGCQAPKNTQSHDSSQATTPRPESLTLREGDTVRITFSGSANLNTVQQIRRDGKISLPLVGEIKSVRMTTSE